MIPERAIPTHIVDELYRNYRPHELNQVVRSEIDRALLIKATEDAFISAFRHGQDLPIGAVVARGVEICGRDAAADNRLGQSHLHAEFMAVEDAIRQESPLPDTLAVTLEPCRTCLEFIKQAGIPRVVFALPRSYVQDLGLINHRPNIFVRDIDNNYPFEITSFSDPELTMLNMILFKNVLRDRMSGAVSFDLEQIEKELRASEQTTLDLGRLHLPQK